MSARAPRAAARRPPRGALTQAEVTAAALDIIATDGIDGLSMRGLSAKLGVALGATYRHVAGRDELLVLCAQKLFEQVDRVRPPDVDARCWIRDLVLQLHDLVRAHRGMAPYMLREQAIRPTGIQEAVLAALAELGLDDGEAMTVAQVLTFYVVGVLQSDFAGVLAAASVTDVHPALAAGIELILRDVARSSLRDAPV